MECSYCHHTFASEQGRAQCGGCGLLGGCRKVKCPRCGYEMPDAENLLRWLRKFGGRRRAAKT